MIRSTYNFYVAKILTSLFDIFSENFNERKQRKRILPLPLYFFHRESFTPFERTTYTIRYPIEGKANLLPPLFNFLARSSIRSLHE